MATFVECFKRLPVFPVSESICIALGIAAYHGDEGEEEESEDQDDLPSRQPEFGLTISFHSKDVDGAAKHLAYVFKGCSEQMRFGCDGKGRNGRVAMIGIEGKGALGF